MNQGLHYGFLGSAERFPDRTAVEVDGDSITYAQLRKRVFRVAATLQKHADDEGPPLCCVLGSSSAATFTGILGALCSGRGYVPILPSFPEQRISVMLQRSRARAMIVDPEGVAHLDGLLAAAPEPMTVILLADPPAPPPESWSRHTIILESQLESGAGFQPAAPKPDDIAYILFTSGSTGLPKGVMVAHKNIDRFLEVVVERYGLDENDRFSHMFDLTFDLSLFDLFGSWRVGACLCVPGPRDKLLPARFVNDSKISVWFSVPSTALLMKKTRTLTEGAFPTLRWSLFCGEALPVEVARAWMEAAPRSVTENLYGPTELTLACTQHRCEADASAFAVNDVVPIGEPYPGMEARVVNEQLEEVAVGESGELILTGPQLTLGYWDDPEKTAAAFVVPPGETRTFYRTGDRAQRPEPGEPLIYLGRLDHQLKVRGYRIELGEVEAIMRKHAGVDAAIAVGWPPAPGGADGIVAFLDDSTVDKTDLLAKMSRDLPKYMLPREIRFVDAFPLNVNGKIDRKALRASLQ